MITIGRLRLEIPCLANCSKNTPSGLVRMEFRKRFLVKGIGIQKAAGSVRCFPLMA